MTLKICEGLGGNKVGCHFRPLKELVKAAQLPWGGLSFHLGGVAEVKVGFDTVGCAMTAAPTGLRTESKAGFNGVTVSASIGWDPNVISGGTVTIEVPHHLLDFWEPLLSWYWPEETCSCN